MIEGLRHILEKQVVIPTFNADAMNSRPDEVDADYTRHAYTFIPMGTVHEDADRLVHVPAKHPTYLWYHADWKPDDPRTEDTRWRDGIRKPFS